MNLIPKMVLTALLVVTPVLSTYAGSGVGGGVTSSQISWCDDASVMIEETRDDAIGHLSQSNDKLGAIRIFYTGFLNASQSSDEQDDNLDNLLTYRSIGRGIRIAQLIGIPQILNGAPVEQGLAGVQQIQGMLSFMDWYSLTVAQGANAVDRSQYSRPGAPFSTLALENSMVQLASSQLRGLTQRFVALKSDRSSYIPLIPVTQFLQALSFLSNEIAADLNETVFANSLGCQSSRLVKLSRQIQTFLSARVNNSGDVSALNKFVLDTKSITNQIENRNCTR